MRFEKRKDRKGREYYSFYFWDADQKRNVRLRKHETPAGITTDDQAVQFCRVREAEHEAVKLRIERKLAWQKRFYDFSRLVTVFESEAKIAAPNSWQGSLYYLTHYALPFFLNEKECNNLNNWSLHFDEFRQWLQGDCTSRRTNTKSLAWSSRNNVIRSLNTFLAVMAKKGLMEAAPKCPAFDSSLINRRTLDDVLSLEELGCIRSRLGDLDPTGLAADFLQVSAGTGLRLSEALALSLADVFEGEPPDPTFMGALRRNDVAALGFVTIMSQARSCHHLRDSAGRVLRKPLKGRRRIDEASGRTIPILDKETFNAIARRYNKQLKAQAAGRSGLGDMDYLLFEGLNKNIYSGLLRKAYEDTTYRHKSPHCARHTFATRFAGLTCGDMYLCQAVLGHKDMETTRNYVHIFAALNRTARTRVQARGGGMNLLV